MNDILDAVRLLKNWQQQQWQALAKLCRIMWLRVKGLNVICSQEIGQSPAAWESSSGHCWMAIFQMYWESMRIYGLSLILMLACN